MAKTYLTKQGMARLQAQLERLQAEREEIRKRLEDLDDDEGEGFGVYYDTETDMLRLDAQIADIRRTLANVEVVGDAADATVVMVGKRVTVEDDQGETFTLDVVNRAEVVHGRRGVADDSPVGKALMGQQPGTTVTAQTPDGEVSYTIHKIEPIPSQ